MMRSLLTASTGMGAMQQNIDVIANNLANVNTTAFKKSRANFHDLIYQTLKAPGQNSTTGTVVPGGIQVGSGVALSSVDKMFQVGSYRETHNDKDLMIEGQGFFQVQLEDGTIAYTRDGNFKTDATGRLCTQDGFPLIPEIVLPPNVLKLVIGMDGVVTGEVDGQKQEFGQIQLANFVNPTGLLSTGRNLYRATEASGDPIVGIPNQNGLGPLRQYMLESSNVNIIEEMVNMITGQRAYELNSKVIQTGDQMLQSTVAVR